MMLAAASEVNATAETIASFLPAAAIGIPFAGSVAAFLFGRRAEKLRNACAALAALLTLAAVLCLYPLVVRGQVTWEVAGVLQSGLFFRVDFYSFVFAALMSFIWFLATLHAAFYMAHEHAQTRFFVFLLATLASCLGVVLAGDLFTLFVFFELMTLLSYVLVIHEETKDAMHAGAVMLYLGVAGGLCLLLGILLLYAGIGTLEIKPLQELIAASALNPYVVMLLFVIGFGVKAGMIPLHIWLPKAHPVAPSPASALLSALMIKTGAYGIFRVVGMIFTPAAGAGDGDAAAVHAALEMLPARQAGYVLIWLGIITMFAGALMALLSTAAKKILAYSSVSQMGYILMGIGVAAYLGTEGAMGFAGALYHIINHAFFKAGFFLMVGTIYMVTHELDITVARGMLKKVPFVAIVFLIGFAGIGGIPGFNGYVSKTLLHHAIVEAAEHSHSMPLFLAEKIFTVTSAMTLCYFTRLFRGLFLGDIPDRFAKKSFCYPWPVYAVLGVFGTVILAIGLFPHFLLKRAVIPAAQGFMYNHHALEHLQEINVWNWHDVQGILVVLALAAILYLVLDRSGFFALNPPGWLSVEYLFYRPAVRLLQTACTAGAGFDSLINGICLQVYRLGRRVCLLVASLDASLNEAYRRGGGAVRTLAERTGQLDGALNQVYKKSGGAVRRLAGSTEQVDNALNRAYIKSGGAVRRLADHTERLDNSLNRAYTKSGGAVRYLAGHTEQLDTALNRAYEKSGGAAKGLVRKTADFDELLDAAYEQTGKRSRRLWDRLRGQPSDWNIKNLNFDALLVALMLGLLLFIIIYYIRLQ
ncbi:MAG: NADH dehydrogenase subunit [Firmicutes bacterium]|nr:NADH dehydrogenase subunit [Bacillota bacterium]